MIVVVTGATGFVGRHLVAGLADAGVKVRPVVRANRPDAPAGAVVATLDDAQGWASVLAGADAVVHLAAHNPGPAARLRRSDPDAFRRVNVDGTALLADEVEKAGVPRFVFASSARVYGGAEASSFAEEETGSPADPYGRSKRDAEAALRHRLSRTGWTILRPPAVYGPGHGGIVGLLARAVGTGLPLPLEGAQARRSLLYVGNLVSAIRASIEAPAAVDKVFNVTDGEALTYAELARLLATATGRRPRVVRSPAVLSALALRLPLAARLSKSLVLDDRRIRETLGWEPPFDTAAGLRATFAAPT